MFRFKLVLLSLMISSMALPVSAKSCSLSDSMIPSCYHKRDKAIIKVALLYYGDYYQMKDLDRIEPILIERYQKAVNNKMELQIISKKILPFKHIMPEGYQFKQIKDPKRLQRIFYSETVGHKIMQEVYEEYKKVESKDIMDELDAVLSITGAQFNGLGFASGRVSVTEQPREIAWNLPGGGRVQYVSDYQIVDELIHELGHNMFLGHTSTQCNIRPTENQRELEAEIARSKACCAASPSKNDALSYCRKRAKVDENFMHGFEACNLSMIENLVIPAMLKGGRWNIKNRKSCK